MPGIWKQSQTVYQALSEKEEEEGELLPWSPIRSCRLLWENPPPGKGPVSVCGTWLACPDGMWSENLPYTDI